MRFALPRGRAAAIPTFGTCRIPFARLHETDASGATSPEGSPSPGLESVCETRTSKESALRKWRLIGCVFLPFAAGYYLSCLFRTITSLISGPLMSEFALDAADIGLLASVYFLFFAAAQLPLGVLLDRFGPRRVEGVLLVIAAGGATLFGTATGFGELLVARAMIGLGVAGALMAGLKAIVIWFPKERVALANGYMIMLGSLGAVTATAPAEWLLDWVGWRGLFEILSFCYLRHSRAHLFVSSRARRKFQKAAWRNSQGCLFGSEILEDRSSVGDFYRVVVGITIVVGCAMAWRGGAV
jgi:MFS family permease